MESKFEYNQWGLPKFMADPVNDDTEKFATEWVIECLVRQQLGETLTEAELDGIQSCAYLMTVLQLASQGFDGDTAIAAVDRFVVEGSEIKLDLTVENGKYVLDLTLSRPEAGRSPISTDVRVGDATFTIEGVLGEGDWADDDDDDDDDWDDYEEDDDIEDLIG